MKQNHPYNLPRDEVIYRIEHIYKAKADLSNVNFDIYDQLLACEAVEESQAVPLPLEKNIDQQYSSVVVSGNDNSGCKIDPKFELTESKLDVISDLSKCNAETSPIVVATLLEELFKEWPSKEGHWLYVAQSWNPKTINSVINQMVKEQNNGTKTIYKAAAYFTYLIGFRKMKKSVRLKRKNQHRELTSF